MTNIGSGGTGAPELTWKQIADSATVRRASRIISILLFPAIGAVAGYFLTLDHRITTIEADRATRIQATVQTNKDMTSSIDDLQADMKTVKSDLAAVKLDAARARGLLEGMQQRQQIGSLFGDGLPATGSKPAGWSMPVPLQSETKGHP